MFRDYNRALVEKYKWESAEGLLKLVAKIRRIYYPNK